MRKRVASLVSLPGRLFTVKIPHAILWTGGSLGLITSVEHVAEENAFLTLHGGMCVCVCLCVCVCEVKISLVFQAVTSYSTN